MSTAEIKSSLVTAEQLAPISSTLRMQGLRCELVEGELRTMSPAGGEHGGIADEIAFQLNLVVRKKKLGKIFIAEAGFVIRRNPDTVRAPDVAFLSSDRLAVVGLSEKYFQCPPTLAVEVVSPSDRAPDVEQKAGDWIASGCQMVWVVRPRDKTIAVYQPPSGMRLMQPGDTLDGGDVVPGFSVKVAELFAGLG